MDASQDQLLGRWELADWQTRIGEQVVRALGDRPRGILIYTAEGCMAVQITGANRAPIESHDPLGGSEHERAEAYAGCMAYCGRYEVLGDRIVHRIELSLFPNWAGEAQTRLFELKGAELILRTPPAASPEGVVVSELRWQRSP